MNFLRIEEQDLENKRILIREDFNVPIKDGRIENDTRIRAAIPTIKLAQARAKQVVIMSHLGRPIEGIAITDQIEFSLAPVAERLQSLLECEVSFVANYLDSPIKFSDLASVILLENVRINSGEKGNSDELGKQYASLCDVFVMDAFATAHRAEASTCSVAKHAKVACAGLLLALELDALERSLSNPVQPVLAIVGGAKVSTKLKVLMTLSAKVDQLIVGGGIANTFLLAAGFEVGRSLCEPDMAQTAKRIMERTKIPLPSDVVVANEFSEYASSTIKAVTDIEPMDMILDIGPETVANLTSIIREMQTIIWNGPIGVFEFDQFATGTQYLTTAIAANRGFSIAGGGETIAAIDKFRLGGSISYISTGGGAFLEYVQGEKLPAVEVLRER